MELKLTNDELELIKYYREEAFKKINQMLVTDSRTDIAILSDEQDDEKIVYDKENVIRNLESAKNIYEIIYRE